LGKKLPQEFDESRSFKVRNVSRLNSLADGFARSFSCLFHVDFGKRGLAHQSQSKQANEASQFGITIEYCWFNLPIS
jgi:hypothetical protein